ncbi:hypothetical protein KQI84_13350 [bacterium]|nr:hypothetical protein [bacterium]
MSATPAPLIVTIGNTVWDAIEVVDRFPAPNTQARVHERFEGAGGQAANAIVALARWGMRTRLVGRVGDDYPGRLLREDLANEGVDITHLATAAGVPSRHATIVACRETHTRTIFCTKPEGLELSAQQAPLEALDGAALLHIDGYHEDACLEFAREANRRGIPVMYDAHNVRPVTGTLMELTDYLITSEEFATNWCGSATAKDVPSLHNGRALTAITFGPNGVHAVDNDRTYFQPAFSIDVIDSTGAGDTFHAAMDYAIVHGWEMERALRFAAAAGALACTGLGARGGIAPVESILELAAR